MGEYSCPRCGSERTRKSGFNESGTQRYLCRDCGKKFTPSYNPVYYEPIKVKCVYCGSKNLKRGGHLRSGAQRYYCKDCNRHFSDTTKIREPIDKTCVNCGSSDLKRCGFNKLGDQRYLCCTCGRKFTDSKNIKPQKSFLVECPICHYERAKKAGKTGHGNQYYMCLSCGHKYLLDGKYQHVTEEQVAIILEKFNQGMYKYAIAKDLGISTRTVYKVTKGMEIPWLKNRTEEINEREFLKQKQIAERLKTMHEKRELKRQYEYIKRKKNIKGIIERYKKSIRSEFISVESNKTLNYIAEKYAMSSIKMEEFKYLFEDLKIQINLEIQEGISIEQAKANKLKLKLQKERLKNIEYDILHGKSLEKISKFYDMSMKVLNKKAEKLYLTETIDKKQEQLIVKYGVMLNVPVDYLAEYVPCSENMCNKIISKYRKKYENTCKVS